MVPGCNTSTSGVLLDLPRFIIVLVDRGTFALTANDAFERWPTTASDNVIVLDAPELALKALKRQHVIGLPCWLDELLAVPRRMKRHFPRALPGPAILQAAARPGRRNRARYRRRWRHANREWI